MIHIWRGGPGEERPHLCQALQKEFGVGWGGEGPEPPPMIPRGKDRSPGTPWSLCPASGPSGPHGRHSLAGWVPSTDLTLAACTLSVWEGKGLQPASMWPTSRGGHEGAAGPRQMRRAGTGMATSPLATPAPFPHVHT